MHQPSSDHVHLCGNLGSGRGVFLPRDRSCFVHLSPTLTLERDTDSDIQGPPSAEEKKNQPTTTPQSTLLRSHPTLQMACQMDRHILCMGTTHQQSQMDHVRNGQDRFLARIAHGRCHRNMVHLPPRRSTNSMSTCCCR